MHCGITEKGAKKIVNIQQLEELVMCKPSNDSEEPSAKTQAVYETIFGKMRRLK